MLNKFLMATLDVVENKQELEYCWKLFNINDQDFETKCTYLKEVMEGEYFDLVKNLEGQYSQLEAMFLNFQWKYAKKLESFKEFVNKEF